MPFKLDGNWVDLATFLVAIAFLLFKHYRVRNQPKFFSKATGYNLMTGTSLFPLVMLSLSIFSSDILRWLLESNKLILSVAGMFALFTLLEDEFEKEPPPRPKRTRRQQDKP